MRDKCPRCGVEGDVTDDLSMIVNVDDSSGEIHMHVIGSDSCRIRELQAQLASQQELLDKWPRVFFESMDPLSSTKGNRVVSVEADTSGGKAYIGIMMEVDGEEICAPDNFGLYFSREALEAAMINTDKMTPDELVRFIAVEVMGWVLNPHKLKYKHSFWQAFDEKSQMWRYEISEAEFDPLFRAHDRDMVVEAMWNRECATQLTRQKEGWRCRMIYLNVGNVQATADTPGKAVCRAALKAILVEKGQEK